MRIGIGIRDRECGCLKPNEDKGCRVEKMVYGVWKDSANMRGGQVRRASGRGGRGGHDEEKQGEAGGTVERLVSLAGEASG